jgi:mercuric ion transport protein
MTLSTSETRAIPEDPRATTATLAAGGLAAGLLSMSCCVLPLALVSLGVGGAWMSYLTALSPYQPYFVGAAALAIGVGLWRAYRTPKACAPGSLCANPATGRVTKAVLWTGAGLVAIAAGVGRLAPYFI